MIKELIASYLGEKALDEIVKRINQYIKTEIPRKEKEKVIDVAVSCIKEKYPEEPYYSLIDDLIPKELLIEELTRFLKPFSTLSDDLSDLNIDFSTLPRTFKNDLISCIIKSLSESEYFETKLTTNLLVNDVNEIKFILQSLVTKLSESQTVKVKTSTSIKRKRYTFKKGYIKRFIVSQLTEDSFKDFYINDFLNPIKRDFELTFDETLLFDNTLLGIIENPKEGKSIKHIVLLSTAGYGKSTELQYLAAHFSNTDSELYPVKVSLNTIENESIEDLLSIEYNTWNNVPENKLIVILDGLDEVHAEKIDFTFKKIEKFATKYHNSYIIVSCRNNFYTIEKENENNGSLKGFKSYFLDDISVHYILKFVHEKLAGTANKFLIEITNKRKGELLRNPFYLTRLVELYKRKHALPETIAELFEWIIDLKIEEDIRHFEKNGKKIELYQTDIFAASEKIALLAESLGRNYITEKEINSIVADKAIIDFLKHSFVLVKDNSHIDRRQFEHNNFQEYLAARLLSRQPIDVIKKFIAFSPDYTKLKPTWLNTVTYLFSVLKSETDKLLQLLQWLVLNEPKVLVRLEFDKIDIELREDIFISLVTDSFSKCLSLYNEDFGFEELIRFSGNSNRIIDFLLHNNKTISNHNNLVDCIELLSYSNRKYGYEDAFYSYFKSIIEEHESSYNVIYHALTAITRLELFDIDFTKYLVSKFKETKSSHKRIGLFKVMLNSPDTEELTLEFLKSTPFINHEIGVLINAKPGKVWEEEPHMYGENETLGRCIGKIVSYNGLVNLINYFISNPSKLDFNKKDKTLATVIENIIAIDSSHNDIFDLMLNWFEIIDRSHDDYKIETFKQYFIKTNSVLKAFTKLFNETTDSKSNLWLACKLADTECINFLLDKYSKGELSDDQVYLFRNGLGWKNKSVFDYFYHTVNTLANNKFLYPPPRNYDEERLIRLKEDLNLLFDKTAFERKIDDIFNEHGSELTGDSLLDIRKSKLDDEELEDNLVINTLREISKNGVKVTKELVNSQILNEKSWLWFKLYHLNNYCEKRSDLLMHEQLNWINEWCQKEIKTADFITAIRYNNNNTISCSYKEVYLFNFFINLRLDYPKNAMLDMFEYGWLGDTQSDQESKPVDYIISKLNENEFKAKIVQNLKKGIKVSHILKNHINIIDTYSIELATPFLIKEIKGNILDEWDKTRTIDLFIKLGGNMRELEELVDYIYFNEKWNWRVFELLATINSHIGLAKLKEAAVTENNWKELSSALLKYRKKEGLEIIYGKLVQEGSIPFDFELPISDIVKIELEDTLEILFRILNFVYLSDYRFTKLRRIDEQVFRCLDEYIGTNELIFNTIQKRIAIEIINHVNDSDKMGHLNFLLSRTEKTFYTKKSETYGLDEIIDLINSLK